MTKSAPEITNPTMEILPTEGKALLGLDIAGCEMLSFEGVAIDNTGVLVGESDGGGFVGDFRDGGGNRGDVDGVMAGGVMARGGNAKEARGEGGAVGAAVGEALSACARGDPRRCTNTIINGTRVAAEKPIFLLFVFQTLLEEGSKDIHLMSRASHTDLNAAFFFISVLCKRHAIRVGSKKHLYFTRPSPPEICFVNPKFRRPAHRNRMLPQCTKFRNPILSSPQNLIFQTAYRRSNRLRRDPHAVFTHQIAPLRLHETGGDTVAEIRFGHGRLQSSPDIPCEN
eukprot:TRINITY_DN1087_c1_g1_i1.p2 TRINITY_DN1087_c1_g1~~TRINITY_DN1087_c1_g1_i1.p2  ORF type:complete len:284 (+),score=19.96 TRINITY_DN1087_c1_g1_i1:109-960(+)